MNPKPQKSNCEIVKDLTECDGCADLHFSHCFSAPSVDCCDVVKKTVRILEKPCIYYCKGCKSGHDVNCSRKKRRLSLESPCLLCGTYVDADPWSAKEFPGDKWMCFPCFKKSKNGRMSIRPVVPDCDCRQKYQYCRGEECELAGGSVYDVRKMTKFFDCCDDAYHGIWLCSECAEEHMDNCEERKPRCSPCLVCGEDVPAHEWYAVEFPLKYPEKKWICLECMKD